MALDLTGTLLVAKESRRHARVLRTVNGRCVFVGLADSPVALARVVEEAFDSATTERPEQLLRPAFERYRESNALRLAEIHPFANRDVATEPPHYIISYGVSRLSPRMLECEPGTVLLRDIAQKLYFNLDIEFERAVLERGTAATQPAPPRVDRVEWASEVARRPPHSIEDVEVARQLLSAIILFGLYVLLLVLIAFVSEGPDIGILLAAMFGHAIYVAIRWILREQGRRVVVRTAVRRRFERQRARRRL